MIQLKEAFSGLSKEEFIQLIDVPVWLALFAAYSQDGVVSEYEKSEAVKLAHLRTFTSPKSIRKFYEKVDEHFEERFETLNKRLPDGDDDKKLYLEAQIKNGHAILHKLDRDVTETLEESLESFYEHVFRADQSFFQYFALPIISSNLEKKSGQFKFHKES